MFSGKQLILRENNARSLVPILFYFINEMRLIYQYVLNLKPEM